MNFPVSGRSPIQLLDFNPAQPRPYKNIRGSVDIQALRAQNSGNPFGKFWQVDSKLSDGFCKLIDYNAANSGIHLKKILAGKVLVDLGCGSEGLGPSLMFASSMNSVSFVAVDISHPPLPENEADATAMKRWLKTNIETNMGITLVASDMLDYLNLTQKNKAVCFMMNRVMGQEFYFPSDYNDFNAYAVRIAGKLTELVTPGNVVFGMSSLPLMALSEKDGWKICGKDSDSSVIFAIRQ